MPSRRNTTATSLFFCALTAAPVLAQTTANFDALTDGDAVTNQLTGLSFSKAVTLASGFSLNELAFPARSGSNVLSDSTGPVTILLTPSVNTFTAYFTHSAAVTIAAFDAGGTQIANTTSPTTNNTLATGDTGSSPNEKLSVTSTTLIAKIVITGAPTGASFAMDDLATTITPPSGGGGGGGGLPPVAPVLTTLSASPTSLTFHQTVGGPAPPLQKFTIKAQSGVASFGVTASDPWISIIQQNAATGTDVTIAVDGKNIQAFGQYDGSVIFTSAQTSNSPFAVPVTLLLHPTTLSKFSADPPSLNFNQPIPGPNPDAQTIQINSAPNQISYTATPSDPWIFASTQPGQTGTKYNVRVSGANLKGPGTYTGSITFNNPVSASNDGFKVPVTLNYGDVSTVSGVVSSATYGTSMTPGTIGALFGQKLATADFLATTIPLPTTLDGVSVTVGGRPAALYYAGKTQVNFQIPTELAPGTYDVVVTVRGTALPPTKITLSQASPAIFLAGGTQAAALNLPEASYNGPDHGAIPGNFIEMFLTGYGPTNPLVPTGSAPPSDTLALIPNVTTTIAGQPAKVLFAGLTPGLVALGQVNLQIPTGLAPGTYPVVITVGTAPSNTATIVIGAPQ